MCFFIYEARNIWNNPRMLLHWHCTIVTRWLYCVECPQYSIRLEALAVYFLQRDQLVMNFRRSVITAEIRQPEISRRWKNCEFFAFFENDPLRENFQNSVPKRFIASLIDVLCSKFVKFGQREIGKVVRYLPDQQKSKLRLAVQLSMLHGSRPQSARASPRKRSQSAPDFIQFGWLSAEVYPNAWTPSKRAVKYFRYLAKA